MGVWDISQPLASVTLARVTSDKRSWILLKKILGQRLFRKRERRHQMVIKSWITWLALASAALVWKEQKWLKQIIWDWDISLVSVSATSARKGSDQLDLVSVTSARRGSDQRLQRRGWSKNISLGLVLAILGKRETVWKKRKWKPNQKLETSWVLALKVWNKIRTYWMDMKIR